MEPEICTDGEEMEFLGMAAVMFPPNPRESIGGDSWVCPKCGFRKVVVHEQRHNDVQRLFKETIRMRW